MLDQALGSAVDLARMFSRANANKRGEDANHDLYTGRAAEETDPDGTNCPDPTVFDPVRLPIDSTY